MNIYEFYENANIVNKEMALEDKYCLLAHLNIINMRYLDINSVFKIENLFMREYIASAGIVYIFPNIINDRIVDVYLRGRDRNSNHYQYVDKEIPYGLSTFNKDFKYGDIIFLVEGIADYGALKLINREANVIVMKSSSISQSSANIIKTLTNKVVFIADNDKKGNWGIKGYHRTKNILSNLGVECHLIEQYKTDYYELKDMGDIVDLVIEVMKTRDEIKTVELNKVIAYYKNAVSYYL